MIKYWVLLLFTGMLFGCNALNFQTTPKVQEQCDYQVTDGMEFQFSRLPESRIEQGYQQVYVAQSIDSTTLPFTYQGSKGKLTDEVLARNYPKPSLWGHGRGGSAFGERMNTLQDDNYEDIYLTQQQRQARDRKAKFVVRRAILQNCEIIYIRIDSLAEDKYAPNLIESDDLTLIKATSK